MSNTINPNVNNLKELWNQVAESPVGQAIEAVAEPVIEAVSKLLPQGEETKPVQLKSLSKDLKEVIKLRGEHLVGCYYRMESIRKIEPPILKYEDFERVLSNLQKSDGPSNEKILNIVIQAIESNKDLTTEEKDKLLKTAKQENPKASSQRDLETLTPSRTPANLEHIRIYKLPEILRRNNDAVE